MGVRGLTTYINYNEDAFLQTFFLHNSCLVIDGHSLCSQLYRKLNCFSAFGGDYDKYASYTTHFFKNLRKCNINAYVIFDGSYEHRKLKTVYSRLRSKINGASRLDPVTQGSLQIFPLLLKDVFVEVLVDMSVPFTVCEFEADDEIAAMARHLNCPVLSYDSDFFIYNVLYIPFNTLEFRPKVIERDEKKVFAIECKIYKVEHLTSHFGGLKEELLPLLATLLGNDYVEKRVFNKFFSQLKLPKSKKKKNDQQRCIHGLFKWLQNETLESAIAKILGRLKKQQKGKVLAILNKSIAGYNSKHCPSLKYFNIDSEECSPNIALVLPKSIEPEEDMNENSDENGLETDDKDPSADSSDEEEVTNDNTLLPDWFAHYIRINRIQKQYINLYTHHLYFCSPQAEDYTDDDCFLQNLPIIRYAFDLMTDFSQESCTYVSRENDSSYKRIIVTTEYAVPRFLEISFPELSDEQSKSCFNYFLEQKMGLLDLALIEVLPSNFQLFMISILWWVSTCSVPLAHVHSLLITYVMLDVIDEKTGTFRGHNHFHSKYSKKIEEYKKICKDQNNSNDSVESELFFNKNKVQYEDCLVAASALIKHFELSEKIQKRPKSYDVKKMHSFAQFQTCLMQFNFLNSLCCWPFEGTKYSKSFSGTFVYNIADKLESQLDPCMFLQQYINGATTVLMFYRSLVRIYEQCAAKMKINTVKWAKKKRGRRKNVDLEEISFIVKGFESEVVI